MPEHGIVYTGEMGQIALKTVERHIMLRGNGTVVGTALAVKVAVVNERQLEPEWLGVTVYYCLYGFYCSLYRVTHFFF